MGMVRLAPSLGALMLFMGAPAAYAQQNQDTSTEDEIVVTGTQIRGIAPTGAQVIGLNEEEIQATGATSTSQVLNRIPQLSEFGGTTAVFGANNFQLAVNRPTLRNLGSGVASTAATLFLMDGHRLPGSGVLQTFPDPDVVPSTLLERVEVVPDGGSSIYGSDAVAGVVNFITRSEFDGVQFTGRYGFGDEFESREGSVTIGDIWDTGSAFVSYSYTNRDAVFAGDRDYVRDINWATGQPTEVRCATPNVRTGPSPNPFTSLSGGPATVCDRARETDLFSSDERNSILAGFSQEIGDRLSVEIKAWHTTRDVESNTGPLRAEVTVPNGVSGNTSGQTQTVQFSFLPVRPQMRSSNELETWGLAPEIVWDIGADWQMRTSMTYGTSRTDTHNPVLNTAGVQAAATAGTLNPYNIADPARLATVNALLDSREWRGFGEDSITQVQSVFDGPVFELPAGQVRVALGAEQFSEEFSTFSVGNDSYAPGTRFTPIDASRDVTAFFAEVNIPLVGDDFTLPLVHRLDVSISGRRDDYSDFGEVETKRFGFTYEPVDWISIAGHWGDSFQAPGLADLARSGNIFTATSVIPNSVLVAPSDAAAVAANGGLSSYNFFAVQGTNPGLEPQNAEAWNVGFDIVPPFLENFSFGATYWSIDYALRIGSALTFISSPTVYQDFGDKLRRSATGMSYDEARALYPAAAATLTALEANGKPLYSIYDFRNTNTGGDRRQGVDIRASYNGETPYGTWFGNLNASHFTNYKIATDVGAAYGPNLTGTDIGAPDWRYSLTLGTTIGENWLAQLTWYHTDSVVLAAPLGRSTATTADDQSEIDAFDTLDLYVQYDFNGSGLTENLSLNFGVQNLTDEEPPQLKRTNGSGAGFPLVNSTLGRVFQVGLSARF